MRSVLVCTVTLLCVQTFEPAYSKPLSVEALHLSGKRVLIRVDFNVPIRNGSIASNQHIVDALDTIELVLDQKPKSVVLMSHRGRPNGKRDLKYSLRPVAQELEKLLNRSVQFLDDCVGPEVEAACADPPIGSVILLENLRFHPEEEGGNVDSEAVRAFQRSLRKLGDVYVNDAFGLVHREHSSMLGLGFPVRAAGLLLKRELKHFSKVTHVRQKPFLAIVGGATVTARAQLMANLLNKVTDMIIVGPMAYTFLKVRDRVRIGASNFDSGGARYVPQLLEKAAMKDVRLYLPFDFVIAEKVNANALSAVVTQESGIPDGYMGLDIGPRSIELFMEPIKKAKLIVWYGPPGVFEINQFANGSRAITKALAEAASDGAHVIVGGGETATCAILWGAEGVVNHISSAGSVSLSLLEGNELPAIKALSPASVGGSISSSECTTIENEKN